MQTEQSATTMTAAAAGSLRPPRILVLEDQASIRAMVIAMLRIRNLDSDEASSLSEAREKIARTRYDLLFIDVRLPDGSGLSLMEEGRPQGAMFVVVTAQSDVTTAVDAMRRGAADFISKPFSVGHFLQRVDRTLERMEGAHMRLQGRARALQTLAQDEVRGAVPHNAPGRRGPRSDGPGPRRRPGPEGLRDPPATAAVSPTTASALDRSSGLPPRS